MWAQLLDQDVVEVGVFAFAKELPDILIAESGERGDLEFKEMVLRGVEIDCVDSAAVFEAESQDIVASRTDGENNVL